MDSVDIWTGRGAGRANATLSVAPMLAVSNTHFRNFIRCLTKRTQLWTEMVTDQAILQSSEKLQDNLSFLEIERPLVCQLGGQNPQILAQAAKYVEGLGFDEINLNVGCPSRRVVSTGGFGAALMRTPELVRDIVHEITRQVQIPVTVKTRIGFDHTDSEDFLTHFVQTVAAGGCQHFIIHARKAWLQGVDPKKNRSLPPLRYDRVYYLCKKFCNLEFTLNGGVKTVDEAKKLLVGDCSAGVKELSIRGDLPVVDTSDNVLKGVMIGRAAANDPCVLAAADSEFYGSADPDSAYSRRTVLEAYCQYLKERELALAAPIHTVLKPVLGILSGMPGQRLFRYTLDRFARKECRDHLPHEVLHRVLEVVHDSYPEVLDAPICCGKTN